MRSLVSAHNRRAALYRVSVRFQGKNVNFDPAHGNPVDRFYNRVFNLWQKPQTVDEAVKQHVPEVLEESHAKKLELATTARDHTVVLGDQLVKAITDQATVSDVRRILDRFLISLNVSPDLFPEKALEYLLHPGLKSPGEMPSTLVGDFHANLGNLVQALEGGNKRTAPGAGADSEKDSYLVKVVCAMAMSNTHEGEHIKAVKCCEVAGKITKDAGRRAGILAIEAGIYNRLGQYEEAEARARKAITESSGTNSQAYLMGATALRLAGKGPAAIALLEEGLRAIPDIRRDVLVTAHKTVMASEAKKVVGIAGTPAGTAAVQLTK